MLGRGIEQSSSEKHYQWNYCVRQEALRLTRENGEPRQVFEQESGFSGNDRLYLLTLL